MLTLIREKNKTGRNQPCPCGSGNKYKKCCGKRTHKTNLVVSNKSAKIYMTMTDKIIKYLENDRNFYTGVQLYQNFGKNKYLLRKFNFQGETEKNKQLLFYQLFKLTGLPDKTFNQIIGKPIPEQIKHDEITEETPSQTEEEKVIAPTITDPVEATKIRIRETFPFLSEKSCPDSLKVLVSDMITAYINYINAHQQLFDVKDEKEAFDVADKVIENYLENRDILFELNHYKRTGKILGKHKYFAADKRRAELSKKSVPELIKLKENLEMNIWRNKKTLEEDPKPHLTKSRNARIEKYETDLRSVKSLLNIND